MPDEMAAHWQQVYAERNAEEMSWTEEMPAASLALIEEAALPLDAAILDLGGGASRLAGELLQRGYSDVTVADISTEALERAKADLGNGAAGVTWIEADVRDHDFGRRFDLWHDRAVFHFMIAPAEQSGYLAVLNRTLRPDGHLIIATFSPEGPSECSGLPVKRYDAAAIANTFGSDFNLVSSRLKDHRTPSGAVQPFTYAHLQRIPRVR